jgi:hypothetical protein
MDDSVFYQDGLRSPFARWSLHAARQRMYDLFIQSMRPGLSATIVDIGVSTDENDASNFLEKLYPHQQMITCAGLGDGQAVTQAFPRASFRQIEPGRPLPFGDRAFDIAYSNAVLEHVGGRDERHSFVSEALRVARNVFIAVPNRWFPVEHHTSLPFLHYAPDLFRRALRGTKLDYWTHPANLDFLSKRLLLTECRDFPPTRVVATGLPLGPFSSNLALIWIRGV